MVDIKEATFIKGGAKADFNSNFITIIELFNQVY
jgi:hypothetical protein